MKVALVYMVAGLSKRFGGRIKQFAKVGPNGETLIEYSLNQALPVEFSKIIFIVGKKTEKPFKEKFGNNYKGVPVYYAFQDYDLKLRNKPWGTTDAVCCVKNILNEPFVVCNGDDIYGEETFKILVEHLKNKDNNATIGYKLGEVLSEEGGVNRAIFELNGDNRVKLLTEVFDITRENLKSKNLSENALCSMNIFAFHPSVLDLLMENLVAFKKRYENDREIECLLPTEINNLIRKGKISMNVYPTTEKWFGITREADEIRLRELLKEK